MANAISYTGVYSFPYPLGTDDISSGAARLQALAERMEAVLVDAGIEIGTYDVLKTSTVFAGDITGLYNALQIGANTITSVELADNSVDSAAIVAGAVTTVKLGVVDLPNGSTATTQTQQDNSTKVATTAYVDAYVAGAVPAGSIDTAELADGAVTNIKVNASAAISYSKLNLTGAILNADLVGNIAYSKLSLTGTIVNADVSTTAAIAYSKLNLATSIVNADISATAAIADTKLATISTASKVSNSATTATDANTASTIVARDASGNFTAGMITANVTGALTGNASTVTTNANLTGDVTSVGNATSIASGVIVNADINASAAISYSKLNLTGSILEADLAFTLATQAELDAHEADTTSVHGITNTANLVYTIDSRLSDARTPTAHASSHGSVGSDPITLAASQVTGTAVVTADSRLSDARTPTGAAGGVLGGTYPNPSFASDMATQVELDAHESDTTSVHGITNTSNLVATTDTSTVTNTMLAGSIVDTKLSTISTASKVSNSATTATDANTASAIVARDASGNFTAGTITAALTGNASTATAAISAASATTATNIAGGTGGSVPYQSAASTTALLPNGAVGQVLTSAGSTLAPIWTTPSSGAGNLTGDVTSIGLATSIASGVIVDADINASAAIVDTKLATISTASKVSNSATTATDANTASTIVARNASGNFTAGTITAALTGNASTATSATSATSATTSTNIAGGAGGSIPYQSAASTTAMLANGTLGQVLTSNGGTSAPSFQTAAGGNLTGDVTSVGLATTIATGVVTNTMLGSTVKAYDPVSISTTTTLSIGTHDSTKVSTIPLVNVTAAATISIPTGGVTGSIINVFSTTTGTVTIQPVSSSVTINGSTSNTYVIGGQFSMISLICYAANTWIITGEYA